MKIYHSVTDLVGHTPLLELHRLEETEKLALQDSTVEDIAQLHSLLERMHRNLQGKAPSGEQKPRLEY